ncbi:MAG: hypothetical protein PSY14_06865 [bacterium]|nr:hypothetical protein [bacterium]
MSDKKYKLSNGLQFNTAAEVDAYIRGLELVRNEIGDDLSNDHAAKFRSWLDEAHSAKSAGPTAAGEEAAAAEGENKEAA